MPPLRVGKARDSLRFEYRLRDFSPPHTHAPSACANCHTDLLRFLPIDGPASDCCPGEFAPASGRKQRSDAVRLRKCRIGICPSRAADKDAQQDWGRPEVWPRMMTRGRRAWSSRLRSSSLRTCRKPDRPSWQRSSLSGRRTEKSVIGERELALGMATMPRAASAVRGQSPMGHARSPGVPARLPIGERSRGNWNIVREPGFCG
jgi:hypothetical protein